MAISAGQVFVDLGARMDRREFEAYEKQLKRIQDRTEKKEHFKAELGANYDERAFRAYQRDLDKAERETHNMVQAQGRLRTAFGSVWAKGGAAFAVAGGVAAITAGAKGAVAAASDINESLTKNKTLFGAYAKDVEKFSRQSADAFGISRSAALEYTGVFGNLSRAIGISEKDSARMSVRLTKLAADLASFNNTSIEDALEALRSGLVGETEPLRRFGITLSAAAVQAEAMRAGLVKVSHSSLEYREAVIDLEKRQEVAAKALKEHGKTSLEFRDAQIEVEKANKAVTKAAAGGKVELTNQQKAMATTHLIFRQTAQAQGDFARTSQGAANQQRILRARLSDMQAEIGAKLLPALVKGTQGINHFIDGMRTGRGVGGQFASVLRTIGGALRRFSDDFTSNERQVAGWVSGFGRVGSTVSKSLGWLIGGSAGRKLNEWGRNIDRNSDAIDRWRRQLTINREVDKIEDDLDRLKNKTNGTLHGILTSTHRNMDSIRKTMGEESARGQEALHDNFQAAVTAIRRAMRQGNISTKTGLAQIRREMLQELRTLGIDSAQRGGAPLSKNPPKGDLPVTTSSPGVTKYMGGWLGGRGLTGHDTIPAMLAPGEAVLNRHQQAVIEGMLGDGFLDRLFAQVNRPHFMQRGGRIRMAVGGVTPAISSLIEELDSKGFRHGSTTGPGHAPGGYHPRGMAVDYGDASNDMQRLWSVVFPQRTRFAELFGPTRVTPGPHLMHNGAGFQNAALQADHQDHIHMALAAAIGALGGKATSALGAAWKALKAPQTAMGGLLGDVVQGTLTRATSLANQRGRTLARTAPGAGPDLSGGPGGGSNSANKALGRTMAAAMGWTGAEFDALDRLWTGESGWSNTARNSSSGAFGIPQALPASKMGPAGAGGNARAQIAWGLNYIKDRYGSPSNAYSTWLGRSPHWYASGGFAGAAGRIVGRAAGGAGTKLGRTVGGATAGLIRRIRPLQTDRSGQFEALMASVDTADENYARWERRFNISDEELVDADSGQVNVAAVQRKVKELGQLLLIRAGMERDLEAARDVAKRIIVSYRRVVTALRNSLRHSKKKNRAGIRSYINQYQPRIAEWEGKLDEVGGSLFDTRTDIIDLRGELKDVLGTAPEIRTPDTLDATDTADTGFDTADTTADAADAAPTPLQIAEAAAQELGSFLSGRQDLLTSFGRNFVPQSGAGATFGSPDPLTAAAGLRNFGGASAGGLGGATIIANFASAPDNAPTFVQQIRFIAEG